MTRKGEVGGSHSVFPSYLSHRRRRSRAEGDLSSARIPDAADTAPRVSFPGAASSSARSRARVHLFFSVSLLVDALHVLELARSPGLSSLRTLFFLPPIQPSYASPCSTAAPVTADASNSRYSPVEDGFSATLSIRARDDVGLIKFRSFR